MVAKDITAVLITKEAKYPPEALNNVLNAGFGEIIILNNCEGIYRRYELAEKASKEFVYFQDDDCLVPIDYLLSEAETDKITCLMKPWHYQSHKDRRIALVGWGSVFPKRFTRVLERYKASFGEDFLYKRETDRIFTCFNYPQKRLVFDIQDLPTSTQNNRMSLEPNHYISRDEAEARCLKIINEETTA